MFAQSVAQLTLIYIQTGRSVRRNLMSFGAQTLETALCVHTVSSSTQQWVPLTLINVHTVFHHHKTTLISFKALALEVSRSVDASALTAEIRRNAALIDIGAVPLIRVQSVSIVAAASEAADGVSASPIGAKCANHSAFIYIF